MSIIGDVQTFLAQTLGWKIDIDEATFEVKLSRVYKELGYSKLSSFTKSLKNLEITSKVLQAFAREFSVGETYFFRDLKFFEIFKNIIIPQLTQNNRHSLSIWSVGCSSGEELYSVAMTLREMIPDIDRWKLYLLGTDVNPELIDKAKNGVFTYFSFRQTPELYKKYFKEDNGTFEISQEIKKMVHFRYHNLMDEPYSCLPPNGDRFDLILLKNVLIYFDIQKARTSLDSLFSLLKEGGYLATTPAEYSKEIFNFPHALYFNDGYLMQKLLSPTDEIDILQDESEIIETVIENLVESEPKANPKQLEQQENEVTYYHNALEKLKNNDLEGAKLFLRRALYLNKDLIMAHVVLANILKKEQKVQSAIKHLKNAKIALSKMHPEEMVELSDEIIASDLLGMIDAIKEESFE